MYIYLSLRVLVCSALIVASSTVAEAAPATLGQMSAGVASHNSVVATTPAPAQRSLGRMLLQAPIRIALTLRYRNQSQLDQLIEEQNDAGSPLYRHWLTNEQFASYFSPTPAQYERVGRVLQTAGFRIVGTSPNRTVIDAVGTIADAEQLFTTQIDRVSQRGYGSRYANVRPALDPPALRGLVLSVDGLNDLVLIRTAYTRAKPMKSTQRRPQAVGKLYGPVSGSTKLEGFGPLAFSRGYDLPNQHRMPKGGVYDGTGRASGVVIDADFLDSDLATFLAYFNIKRTGPATKRVLVDGGPPPSTPSGPNADAVEATLDAETIVSNAPGTGLYVYEFPSFSSDQYITDAYNQVVSDNLVDTVNSSFGGCELSQISSAKAWDAIAAQGAAKGITFHASSGDFGSWCSNLGPTDVEAPASSPHFVAVGGTTLFVNPNGYYNYETAWGAPGLPQGFDPGGSGGGVSYVFALPRYQQGTKNVIPWGRNVPDVAFDANPQTGVAFFGTSLGVAFACDGTGWNTGCNPLGGTSLASPIFGAALTEIDQLHNGRSGLAAQRLFAIFRKDGYSHSGQPFFHDIIHGYNGGYYALPGYDNVTGIGSIDFWNALQ